MAKKTFKEDVVCLPIDELLLSIEAHTRKAAERQQELTEAQRRVDILRAEVAFRYLDALDDVADIYERTQHGELYGNSRECKAFSNEADDLEALLSLEKEGDI